MLNWLWERLEKEREAITKAPIHFGVACLIATIIIGILWFTAFSTALLLKSNTIQAYKDRYGDLSAPNGFVSLVSPADSHQPWSNPPSASGVSPQIPQNILDAVEAARAHRHQGDIYASQKNVDAEVKEYEKEVAILRQLPESYDKRRSALAESLTKLGTAYRDANRIDDAQKIFMEETAIRDGKTDQGGFTK